MKLAFLLIFVFASTYNGSCQLNDELIVSKGEFPKILKDELIPYYTLPTFSRDQYFKLNSKHNNRLCRSTILNSGFVSFGTEDINRINADFKELLARVYPTEKYEVFFFRSIIPTTFRYDKSIFITTKLLASLSKKEEVLFFLMREVEAAKMQNLGRNSKSTFHISSLNDFVKFASIKSDSVEMILDKLAYEKLAAVNFQKADMVQALFNASQAEMPFQSILMKPNYLESSKLEIPENLFDEIVSKSQDKLSYIIDYENKYKSRIKVLGEPLAGNRNDKLSNEYSDFFLRAKIELVRLDIANSDFLSAIYKIYNLETEYKVNVDLLKAMAWYGIVDQEFGGNKRRKSLPFYGSNHLSSGFYNFMNVQNGYVKTLLALNVITKLMEDNQSINEFKTIRKEVIQILNRSKFFDPKALMESGNANDSITNDQIKMKNTNFYLGKLNRFVEPNELLSLEAKQAVAAEQIVIESGNERILIKSLDNLKFDSKRSEKLTKSVGGAHVDYFSTAYYNEFENYALMMYQLHENSAYQNTVLPVNFAYYAKNKTNLTYHDFMGDYRWKFKPVYFIGLTGIGLAYVAPNLALASQSTWNTMVVFEKETGSMLALKHEFNRDYLTKMNILARKSQTSNY